MKTKKELYEEDPQRAIKAEILTNFYLNMKLYNFDKAWEFAIEDFMNQLDKTKEQAEFLLKLLLTDFTTD